MRWKAASVAAAGAGKPSPCGPPRQRPRGSAQGGPGRWAVAHFLVSGAAAPAPGLRPKLSAKRPKAEVGEHVAVTATARTTPAGAEVQHRKEQCVVRAGNSPRSPHARRVAHGASPASREVDDVHAPE